MKDSSRFSAKANDFIEIVLLMALFVTVFIGLLFGLRYESFSPLVGTFSGRYLVACLAPAALVFAVICGLLLRPSWRRRLPECGGPFAATVVFGGAIPALAGVVLWTSSIPESRLALALGIAVPGVGVLFAARALARPQMVLAVVPIVVIGAAVLVVEVPLLTRPTPVRWGDDNLFAYIHPKTPPFLGPGGRLRAGVNCDQKSAEFPRGAAVVTNRDGFRNRHEFGEASGDETRILSLGDSFSTGYSMPQDRFFGSLLERAILDLLPEQNIVVMNAEVSNPAHGLYYLQKFGLRYRPKVVLFGLSGNDIVQTEHFFGPSALFTDDGEGALINNPDFDRKRPSPINRYREFAYPAAAAPSQGSALAVPRRAGDRWMAHLGDLSVFAWLWSRAAMKPRPVPMYSYAENLEIKDGRKRLIDGVSDLGLYYPAGAKDVENLYRGFFTVLEGMRRATEAAGAEFVLVIFPQRFQLQPQDWQVMCERWSLDHRDFDLTLPNRRIVDFCAETGLRCVDLLVPMMERAAGQGLYLPGGDMHFNSAGCRLAAEITADSIEGLFVQTRTMVGLLDEGRDPR